jgi:branched-chain amino acid transport system substrate-binding protein
MKGKARTKALAVFLPVLLALTVTAAGGAASERKSAETGPITLAILAHNTGAVASVGPDKEFGVKAGVALATNGTFRVAGREIKFVVGDDGSDAGRSSGVARRIVLEERPAIVFGFDTSSSALASERVMVDAKIPSITSIAAADELTAYSKTSFRTSRNATQEATMGAAVVNIKKGQTYMILAPDYAYGQSAAKAWDAILAKKGGQSVGPVLFAPLSGNDYTAAAERVRTARPQILVVVTFGGSGGPLLWQALDRAGVPERSKTYTLLPQRPTRVAMGDVAKKISYFAIYDPNLERKNKLHQQFLRYFSKLSGGKRADIYAGDAAVAGWIAVQALRKTNGSTDSDAIVRALEGQTGTSIKGAYQIRKADHVFIQSFYEAKIGALNQGQLVKRFPLGLSRIPITKTVG